MGGSDCQNRKGLPFCFLFRVMVTVEYTCDAIRSRMARSTKSNYVLNQLHELHGLLALAANPGSMIPFAIHMCETCFTDRAA